VTTGAEPLFLSVEDVLALHDDQLRLFGGSAGVRDRGALESAVATPEASFDDEFLHEDLFHMAATYAFHITENQPFVDGNKRTGLNAALVFLDVNGWVVEDPEMRLFDAMIAVSSRALDKHGLAWSFGSLRVPTRTRKSEVIFDTAAQLRFAADAALAFARPAQLKPATLATRHGSGA
jgi:death on curing protein